MAMNDPQRAHLALYALKDMVGLPKGADGIGVAVSVDGAVLLSRLPSMTEGATLAELVGPMKGRCAVVQVRTADELRPRTTPYGGMADATDNLGPFRARAFAGAVVGGPQDGDEASAQRDALLADLPDFLRRSVAGHAEGEAFFFAVLARLHRQGVLDVPGPKARFVAAAVKEVLDACGSKAPRHVAITTGLEVVHVAHGMPSALVTVEGLSEEVANRVDPTLCDSSMGRERLRRFRGALAIGALDVPLKATAPLPPGVGLTSLPEDAVAIIGNELKPVLL
jgi:hypothetical protein